MADETFNASNYLGTAIRLLPTDKSAQSVPVRRWLTESALVGRVGLDRKARSFTPFIGAGTLQLRSGDQVDWDAALDAHARAAEAHDGGARIKFLAALKDMRLGDKPLLRQVTGDSTLSQVRIALFDLVFTCTSEFTSRIAADGVPILSWQNTPIAVQSSVVKSWFGPAKKAVQALIRAKRTATPGLKNATPANGDNTPGVDLFGAEALKLRLRLMETEVSDLGLTGSAVEYLTQVFWHSVTFSSVVYPHSDDLAIQVSLALGGSQPTKRRSPPEAVQRPANADAIPELARTIAASVSRGRRYGKAGTSERDRFFDSVGAVMQSTYDLYRAQLDTVPFNHDGRGAIEPPVVFTTNFDLEIERALATSARTATCYYVAIPVVVEGESKARASSAGTLRWVVGRFKTAKAIRTSMLVKSDGEEGDWMWFSQMDEPELLNGPLLVKLNGSPLHEVPTEARKIGEDNGDTNRVHRATLIDEVDFVEAMRADTSQYVKFKNGARRDFGFPDWLSESLDSESRFWLFCGNRLADWTLRLHLLTQFDRIGADSNLVWDVAKDVNDERVQLLWWFGVKSVDGDCGLLTPGLLQFSTELQKEAKRLERGRK